MLMRMNSTADLEFLRAVFSFMPAGLFDRAPTFSQGHALVAGKVMPQAGYVRFGTRTAEEGGAQHCQRDYLPPACEFLADWLEDKLK